MSMMDKNDKLSRNSQGMSRRRFIEGSLAVLAGTGLTRYKGLFASDVQSGPQELRIKEYRTLGRTGFKVSDIGLGSGELTEPALLNAVLDAGINYIDTAENYRRGRVERTIGTAIKNRNRKAIFITTKLVLRENETKKDVLDRAYKCLERLQTEYIDCLMIHKPSTVEQTKHEGFHAAIRELKTDGKVRFCGLSNHGSQWQEEPETMEKVLLAAAEDSRFDVMLFVYNFLQREMGESVLKACKEKNIGATLMKTNPVLNYLETQEMLERAEKEGRQPSEYLKKLLPRLKERADKAEAFKKKYSLANYEEIRDVAVKFVLSHPDVHSACLTIKNYSDLEAYVSLSGTKFDSVERKRLSAYKEVFGDFYCRHACGICESKCPHGVPVNTVMRYNHYFKSQGREKTAVLKYASLETNRADFCMDCPGYCEKACPYGVPVQSLLVLAHQTLTLA